MGRKINQAGNPKFFINQSDFRKWLEKNSDKKKELLVGFYKTGSGKKSITWPESVNEALCFGWIDGVRKSIDEESYSIRFTPRKPKSNWSAINIKKIEELTANGLMHPHGIAAYEQRKESRSKIYSYEKAAVKLSPEFEKKFKDHKKAWSFFQSQGAYYQKQATNWIMSAKQEATKLRRLQTLSYASEKGNRY